MGAALNPARGSGRPEISVVTVVMNGVAHLRETVDSVLAQQGVDIEYWIIDGGSDDGSVDVIRQYGDRLTGWVSEPDRGIADAFNKGLSRARGDYVMFLNADDALAAPDVLARMMAHARAHDWPDVLYGDCDLHDPADGRFLYRAVIQYDRARFLRLETLPHPGMLMHRRYFAKFGIFDTSFRIAMDYELFLRGVPTTGAHRVPVVVTRVRAGGISARSRTLVVEETIRALRMHGHLGALAEGRMRAVFAARGLARRILERTGLYPLFDGLRHMRRRPVGHG